MRTLIVATAVLGWTAGPLLAQTPSTAPANDAAVAPPAASQPAETIGMQATAIKVVGNVSYAAAGPDGKPGEFKPLKEGDKLAAGTLIQTRLRSKVMLSFGEDAVVLVDRVTLASIDSFHRTGDTKKVDLGLGHGLIRAATVETTLRSEMTIASPVATLSKRGTIDFGMHYEAGTGRYTIWLNQEGLVQAFDQLRGTTRRIQPGQYVTQALMRWIETLTMDRYVAVTDNWGLTSAEQNWNAQFGAQGTGVVDPAAGGSIFTSHLNPTGGQSTGSGGSQNYHPYTPSTPTVINGVLNITRPEGNFGTGLGE